MTTEYKPRLFARDEEIRAIGEGLLDHVTFLELFQASCPDGYVMIGHLPDDRIPGAKRALDAAMAQAGLAWQT